MPSNSSTLDTHDRILEYLKENRSANVPELSRQWGLTRADIRFHMSNLLREGLIQRVPQEKVNYSSRGRPILEYRLTSQYDIGNYQSLCDALMNLFKREEFSQAASKWTKLLAETMADQPMSSTSPTHTLNMVVEWLNERGYHARWEAAAAGPLLMYYHCPYAAILADHPELCKLDIEILEFFLTRRVVQKARIIPQSTYPRACIFQMASSSEEP